MSVTASAITAGAMLVGTGLNWWQNRQHRADQKLQQDTMREREDNAVQRRVADLEAAGLHPTLAAGQPAHAGPGNPLSPPEKADFMQVVQAAMFDAQRKNLEAQTDKLHAETVNIRHQDKYLSETMDNRIKQSTIDTWIKEVEHGMLTNRADVEHNFLFDEARLRNALKQVDYDTAYKDWQFYSRHGFKLDSVPGENLQIFNDIFGTEGTTGAGARAYMNLLRLVFSRR